MGLEMWRLGGVEPCGSFSKCGTAIGLLSYIRHRGQILVIGKESRQSLDLLERDCWEGFQSPTKGFVANTHFRTVTRRGQPLDCGWLNIDRGLLAPTTCA
jgi:hypothetical protein